MKLQVKFDGLLPKCSFVNVFFEVCVRSSQKKKKGECTLKMLLKIWKKEVTDPIKTFFFTLTF